MFPSFLEEPLCLVFSQLSAFFLTSNLTFDIMSASLGEADGPFKARS